METELGSGKHSEGLTQFFAREGQPFVVPLVHPSTGSEGPPGSAESKQPHSAQHKHSAPRFGNWRVTQSRLKAGVFDASKPSKAPGIGALEIGRDPEVKIAAQGVVEGRSQLCAAESEVARAVSRTRRETDGRQSGACRSGLSGPIPIGGQNKERDGLGDRRTVVFVGPTIDQNQGGFACGSSFTRQVEGEIGAEGSAAADQANGKIRGRCGAERVSQTGIASAVKAGKDSCRLSRSTPEDGREAGRQKKERFHFHWFLESGEKPG